MLIGFFLGVFGITLSLSVCTAFKEAIRFELPSRTEGPVPFINHLIEARPARAVISPRCRGGGLSVGRPATASRARQKCRPPPHDGQAPLVAWLRALHQIAWSLPVMKAVEQVLGKSN